MGGATTEGGDATGQCNLLVDVAHAAQVAFAFFAHVAEKNNGGRQLDVGVNEGVGKGQHANYAGTVIACAGRLQPIAIHLRAQGGFRGKYCV